MQNVHYPQLPHVRSGHVNSTAFHNQQAPCYGCSPAPLVPLRGIPPTCQWRSLQSTPGFRRLLPGGRGRFAAYDIWYKELGICGVRVKPPSCVLNGIQSALGQSQTGFVPTPNPCRCATCLGAGEEEEEAEASVGSDDSGGDDDDDDGGGGGGGGGGAPSSPKEERPAPQVPVSSAPLPPASPPQDDYKVILREWIDGLEAEEARRVAAGLPPRKRQR